MMTDSGWTAIVCAREDVGTGVSVADGRGDVIHGRCCTTERTV